MPKSGNAILISPTMYIQCSAIVMSCDSHVVVKPSHMIISREMHDCSLVLAMHDLDYVSSNL